MDVAEDYIIGSYNGTLFHIVVAVVGVIFLVWIGKVMYFAFIKKKNEHEKQLVIKSMVQAFVAVFIFNILYFVISSLGYLTSLFERITTGIEIHPVVINIVFLGVTIFINKRRYKEGGVIDGMDKCTCRST